MIKNKVKKDQLFQIKPVNMIMTKTIADRVLCFKTDALEAIEKNYKFVKNILRFN
jgi:hypothetical protein